MDFEEIHDLSNVFVEPVVHAVLCWPWRLWLHIGAAKPKPLVHASVKVRLGSDSPAIRCWFGSHSNANRPPDDGVQLTLTRAANAAGW